MTIYREYATDLSVIAPGKEVRDQIERIITDSKRECEHQLAAQSFLRTQYANFRKAHELNCILALVTVEGAEEVFMIIFKGVQVHDEQYEVHYDEEEKCHYIELQAIECKGCSGSGMSGPGTGYGDVCDDCGGNGEHPRH